MKTVSGKQINASAQLAMKRDVRAMFADMTRQLTTMLILRSGADGKIDLTEAETIRREARPIVERYFVNPSPFDRDGVTPLARFPRILNKFYVQVVGRNLKAHDAWMKRNVPEDIYTWLALAQLPADLPTREMISPVTMRKLLLNYDPMHTWVDPNGYRLSDRIWNTSDATRKQIDGLMQEQIRLGKSATDTAKLLERFLNPDAALLRTKKPYGRDGSYYARNLSRTEISRAHNHAAVLAAQLNPYVDRMDIARSRNGDPNCPICPDHATIDIDGSRIRDPIPIDEVEPPPFHPSDKCNCRPVTTDDPQAVTDELRASMQAGEPAPITPAANNTLLKWVLGTYLFNQWMRAEAA